MTAPWRRVEGDVLGEREIPAAVRANRDLVRATGLVDPPRLDDLLRPGRLAGITVSRQQP